MSDSIVILSRNVFPATGAAAFDGFVAVEDGIIKAVGAASDAVRFTEHATRVIDAGERTVMPGMTDVHTFFSGWVLETPRALPRMPRTGSAPRSPRAPSSPSRPIAAPAG